MVRFVERRGGIGIVGCIFDFDDFECVRTGREEVGFTDHTIL